MRIEYVVIDEGNCTVETGNCEFDRLFNQRVTGWLQQGWSVRVWNEDDDHGHSN